MQLSVVIPVLNEENNVEPLLHELEEVLRDWQRVEVICVDDHSADGTLEVLRKRQVKYPWLRIVRHREQSGQSAAVRSGVQAARYPLIATLDGDGQNDPCDIAQLVTVYHREKRTTGPCLVIGRRLERRDAGWRRLSSLLANAVRRRLLGDDTPDSGCGIKVFSRADFLDLPSFNHMHRFVPALVHQRGGAVISVSVNHRSRTSGSSHYGTLDRLVAGIIDLAGVLWLARRAMPPASNVEHECNG
jgi:dolichol-phosphate mannosyltransferase